MRRRKLEICFTPDFGAEHLSLPKPAKSYIPQWYKDSSSFMGGKMVLDEGGSNGDIKLCIPFLDALMSGYIIETWQDIMITRDSETNEVKLNWPGKPDILRLRNHNSADKFPRPSGYHHQQFTWLFPYGIKTPKGYSCLFTQPLNRNDLPFFTATGVIDSDSYYSAGNIPFFLREDAEGVIPRGTPIAQVIPFKREDWTSSLGGDDMRKQMNSFGTNARSVISGFYKKNTWKKKTYQ